MWTAEVIQLAPVPFPSVRVIEDMEILLRGMLCLERRTGHAAVIQSYSAYSDFSQRELTHFLFSCAGDLYLSCKRRSLWRLVSGVCVSPTRGRDALATAGGTPALQSFFPAAVKACPSQTIYEMGCQVELRMSLSQMGSRRSRPEVGRLLNGPVDRFEEHLPVSG